MDCSISLQFVGAEFNRVAADTLQKKFNVKGSNVNVGADTLTGFKISFVITRTALHDNNEASAKVTTQYGRRNFTLKSATLLLRSMAEKESACEIVPAVSVILS